MYGQIQRNFFAFPGWKQTFVKFRQIFTIYMRNLQNFERKNHATAAKISDNAADNFQKTFWKTCFKKWTILLFHVIMLQETRWQCGWLCCQLLDLPFHPKAISGKKHRILGQIWSRHSETRTSRPSRFDQFLIVRGCQYV